MRRTAFYVLATVAFAGLWAVTPSALTAGGETGQTARAAASAFELKMRILVGSREKPADPAKPVTSSFLRFMNFVNFDLEQDLVTEQQIKKIYNLKDVSLLTEATLVWEKGKAEKAFHAFRLNGQEYLVMVTPGRLPERNRFRIEVYEQGSDKKASLLDSEFSLPDKSAAVFGFEDTQLKPYFITLRVVRWLGEPPGVSGGVAGGGGSAKIVPPKLIKQVNPVYPEEAKKAGVEGLVVMEATTDLYGRVASVKVLRGVPALDQAATDALKQWVYEPMVINGKPQPVIFVVTVRFKLDGKDKSAAGGVQGGVAAGVEGGVAGGVEGGVAGGVAGGVPAGTMSAQELQTFEGDAVRAEGVIKPPRLIKTADPIYPEEARQAKVEGVVILGVKTDETGKVKDVIVLRSIPLLDQAAIDAVRQWVYEPLIKDGKAVSVLFTVTVRFQLE